MWTKSILTFRFIKGRRAVDASMFYSINGHIKVGVQGVNLTDTVTKTEAAVYLERLGCARSYHRRRFWFIVR